MDNYVFPDAEYGKVLDNFVIACVDVALTYKGMILLERRQKEPIKGEWWIFGGRMLRGESCHTAAARGISRELGVGIQPERFREIGTYNLMWPKRREPVTSNGCHHILVAYSAQIYKKEFEMINSYIKSHKLKARWHKTSEIYSGKYLNQIKDITTAALL